MPARISYFWPILLIIAAAVSLIFVVRRIRRGTLPGLAGAGAVLFRVGLIGAGIVYAAALPYRAPGALWAVIGIAATGAVLSLASVIRARSRLRREGGHGMEDEDAGREDAR
jgi:hypothetical protein